MTTPVSGGSAPVYVYAADAVVTMSPDTPLRAVADELTRSQIGVVVLGSQAQVEGVISERDIVHAVAEGKDPATTLARELESRDVVWCDSASTVQQVAELMMEKYVRHVLLERDGHLVGIVSARDLLSAYAIEESAEAG